MDSTNELLQLLRKLIGIDSPIGYTRTIENTICQELEDLGYSSDILSCGGVYCSLNNAKGKHILLTAHIDTLGAMIKSIENNGHLEITPLGGLNANNIEGENCRIYTRSGRMLTGVAQLKNASIHVNKEYDETKRSFDTIEIVIDEDVHTEEEVYALGINIGDIIAFDPRFTSTESGYIKSRFLDDKAGVTALLMLAKQIKGLNLVNKISLFFSASEEMGYGGAVLSEKKIDELIAVDMGCVGAGLKCNEKQVSICAKDSGGPYNYEMVSCLIECARAANLDYAVDIYPFYKSDVEVALRAGASAKHALLGMGVYASHGYERTHIEGIMNTLLLLEKYILSE